MSKSPGENETPEASVASVQSEHAARHDVAATWTSLD